MKQISTLLSMAVLCLFTNKLNAQFSQNFDTNGSYSSNCWDFNGFFWTTSSSEVINGTGSLYTNPPVNSTGSRDVYTPYLDIPTPSLSVSFNYKLTSTLNGQAVRRIEVGLMDVNNVFTSLDTFTMNTNTPNQTQTNVYSKTFTTASASIQRLVLRFSGDQGDGNTRMIVDDLLTNANAHYNNSTHCNSVPMAANDTYYATATGAYTGTTVLANDSDPNTAEILTASMAATSPDGTVVLNADGTFTFTPKTGFTRAYTTFTYKATDNGYTPMAATATVTIYFPTSTLALNILHFSGTLSSNKATINWSVTENETVNYFEVQKSSDGKDFRAAGVLFSSAKTNEEAYAYSEKANEVNAVYYRLKIVSSNNTVQYSKTVSLKYSAAQAASGISLLQNPVQQLLNISYQCATAGNAGVTIYTSTGTVVYTGKVTVQKGINKISIGLPGHYAAGSYLAEVWSSAGRKAITFMKQ